ncbi:MAG: hypothetical protein EA397_09735 [Deltaproteobacteria bacterium]|nr:MAG: hypothetical protein EA397_09735 [Deltaproteobacteria bacterium]
MRAFLFLTFSLVACAAPVPGSRGIDFGIDPTFETGTTDDAAAAAVDLIDSTTHTLRIALPAGQDTRITDAILSAWRAGVDVEVVTDWDQQNDPGILDLMEAEVPLRLANDGLEYFEFALGRDVVFPSEDTVLSSSFICSDRIFFLIANDLGHVDERARFILSGNGQDFTDDLLKEHNQLFGGTDAVSTTAFANPAKSIADPRWLYRMHDGRGLELWFGPQQRLTKRIIDAIYRARANVRVLTDDLSNDGLARALQDKAGLGFDVEVIVGEQFGTNSSALARDFLNSSPDVVRRRIRGPNPTVVIIDTERARDGHYYPARVFSLSHDLVSAKRLYQGDPVKNDQLIDGVLWVVEDELHQGSPRRYSQPLRLAVDLYEDHFARSRGL